MRLIDADELIKRIENSRNNNPHKDCRVKRNHDIEHYHFIKMVYDQPTAFDKEKVLDELKGEIDLVVHNPMINPIIAGRYIKKNRAIEIVKKGGIE